MYLDEPKNYPSYIYNFGQAMVGNVRAKIIIGPFGLIQLAVLL